MNIFDWSLVGRNPVREVVSGLVAVFIDLRYVLVVFSRYIWLFSKACLKGDCTGVEDEREEDSMVVKFLDISIFTAINSFGIVRIKKA